MKSLTDGIFEETNRGHSLHAFLQLQQDDQAEYEYHGWYTANKCPGRPISLESHIP